METKTDYKQKESKVKTEPLPTFKQRLKEELKHFWMVRLYCYLTSLRLCKSCHKEKPDESFNGLCFKCYFKTLKKTKGGCLG
jgi:hypothetical protein